MDAEQWAAVVQGLVAVDGFEIKVDSGTIRILVEEVYEYPGGASEFGGYDVRGAVEIRCGAYRAYGYLGFSTGEVRQFYSDLLKAHRELAGQARFRSSEGNLELTITFEARGHCIIEGTYRERYPDKTQLQFEIKGDQSYLVKPLAQLAEFVARYGDNQGYASSANAGLDRRAD